MSDSRPISEKLTLALSALVQLKITTYLGDVQVSGNIDDLKVEVANTNESQAIVTRINLVDGDIQTTFSKTLWESTGSEAVRAYHQEQVKQGREIVNHNLTMIKEVAVGLVEAIQKLREHEKPVT